MKPILILIVVLLCGILAVRERHWQLRSKEDRKDIRELQERFDADVGTYHGASRKWESLEENVGVFSNKVARLSEQIETERADKNSLRKQTENAVAERNDMSKNLDSVTQELTRTKTRLAEVTAQRAAEDARNKKLESTNAMLHEDVMQLIRRMEKLQGELAKLNAEGTVLAEEDVGE